MLLDPEAFERLATERGGEGAPSLPQHACMHPNPQPVGQDRPCMQLCPHPSLDGVQLSHFPVVQAS